MDGNAMLCHQDCVPSKAHSWRMIRLAAAHESALQKNPRANDKHAGRTLVRQSVSINAFSDGPRIVAEHCCAMVNPLRL